MKTIRVLCVLLFIAKFSIAQKTVLFHYQNNEITVGGKSAPVLSTMQNFSTVRTYIDDAEFKESGLFTGDHKRSVLYKIVDQIWYYKNQKRWQLFYNFHTKKGGVIDLMGTRCRVVFNKEVLIHNKLLHKLYIKPVKVVQSHNLAYYFDPKSGVVLVKNSWNGLLLRTDFFTRKLTIQDQELL